MHAYRRLCILGGLRKTGTLGNVHLKTTKQSPDRGACCFSRKLSTTLSRYENNADESILSPLREQLKSQGELVRHLKASQAGVNEIKQAVSELKARRKRLEDKERELRPKGDPIDRVRLEHLLKKQFFFDQSFDIYNGATGQFDLGPLGCTMKYNILALWRKFFILEEQMLEVDCSILTPESVLRVSGHVDKFCDWMVYDILDGNFYRLDHVIRDHLELILRDKSASEAKKGRCRELIAQLDNLGQDELQGILKEFAIKAPLTKNDLSEPKEFNLMFQTQLGATGKEKGSFYSDQQSLLDVYLRPETAQGIFVNFQRLLKLNQGRLPFAAAQIGTAFRNEVSPKSGLIRTREFTLAEIEYFCDPGDKSHPKFGSIKSLEVSLYSACNQMDGTGAKTVTLGAAVESGLIASESLGYFMARIQQFLARTGVDMKRFRFRQHMSNEIAHYASDCWDGEIFTSYGWLECIGCADRSAFDLGRHQKATNARLVAEKKLDKPHPIQVVELIPDKVALDKAFGKKMKSICQHIVGMDAQQALRAESELSANSAFHITVNEEELEITANMIQKVKRVEKLMHVEEFIPSVIEPSFGIGRILYALLEHSYRARENDDRRRYFSLSPIIAPVKCSLLPLSSSAEFSPLLETLSRALTSAEVTHKVDTSTGSIGRRYSRCDEIGIPFAVCVDFDSLNKPHTVTIRERDSTGQVRLPVEDVSKVIRDLSFEKLTWDEVMQRYPRIER